MCQRASAADASDSSCHTGIVSLALPYKARHLVSSVQASCPLTCLYIYSTDETPTLANAVIVSPVGGIARFGALGFLTAGF